MDKLKIKKQIIDFTIQGVKAFLRENPALEFYAFAYDCNAEYAELSLCFNTLSDFEETLHHYQNGSFSEKYNSDEEINDIKYNTGDWEYQCFETINVLSEEQLNQIFNNFPDDDYKYWNQFKESLMELFCECLLEFENSDVFKSIPKSDSFLLLCMDHDDDLQLAQERLERVKFQFKNS